MPLIILLGFLAVFAIMYAVEKFGKKAPAHTPETLEKMDREMRGKSQAECRRILKKYRNIE